MGSKTTMPTLAQLTRGVEILRRWVDRLVVLRDLEEVLGAGGS